MLSLTPPPDRRRWPRARADLAAMVEVSGTSSAVEARVIGASARGVTLAIQPLPTTGTQLRMSVCVGDGGEHVVLAGVVVHMHTSIGVGVFLTEVHEAWLNLCACICR